MTVIRITMIIMIIIIDHIIYIYRSQLYVGMKSFDITMEFWLEIDISRRISHIKMCFARHVHGEHDNPWDGVGFQDHYVDGRDGK